METTTTLARQQVVGSGSPDVEWWCSMNECNIQRRNPHPQVFLEQDVRSEMVVRCRNRRRIRPCSAQEREGLWMDVLDELCMEAHRLGEVEPMPTVREASRRSWHKKAYDGRFIMPR